MSQDFTKRTIRDILTANGQSVLDETLDKVKVSNATAADLLVQLGTSSANIGIVRQGGAGTSTDGWYVRVADSTGNSATIRELGTNDALNIALCDGSGNQLTNFSQETGGNLDLITTALGSGATALGKQEDAAHVTADVGIMALAVQTATPINRAGTDGDYEPLQISVGRLWTSATIDAALPTGTNVIGALTANQSVNVAQINGVTPLMGAGNTGTGSPRVTIATDQVVIPVGGNVAHDAADSGNPVKLGFKAIAHGTNPTAVAASDRTDWYANRAGVPFILGGHPNIKTIELADTDGDTNIAIVTVAAGLKIVVTRVSFVCSNANTVNVAVRVGFGTASTPTTTGVLLSHPGVAPGSGIVEGNGSGILGVGADDEDLRITNGAPTSGSCRTIVSYFTIES